MTKQQVILIIADVSSPETFLMSIYADGQCPNYTIKNCIVFYNINLINCEVCLVLVINIVDFNLLIMYEIILLFYNYSVHVEKEML